MIHIFQKFGAKVTLFAEKAVSLPSKMCVTMMK